MVNLANATSITLQSGGTIDGVNAYLYQVAISLGTGETISDASLTFNDITLTTSSPVNTVGASLIDLNHATTTYSDNDGSGNYFASSTFRDKFTPHLASSAVHSLGSQSFTDPYQQWPNGHYVWVYDTQSWTWSITGATLSALNADLTSFGKFDIGVDPDCIYDVGSITLNYTVEDPNPPQSVPDGGTTASLLGMGLLGLAALRRKLAAS